MTKRGWARQFAVPSTTRVFCYTGEWYWAAYSG